MKNVRNKSPAQVLFNSKRADTNILALIFYAAGIAIEKLIKIAQNRLTSEASSLIQFNGKLNIKSGIVANIPPEVLPLDEENETLDKLKIHRAKNKTGTH